MVTICTTSLTFSNSTFCPHTVFMCFVWISEQTAIISLYNVHWLVFITQTQCVYCAVRTGSLTVIHVSISLALLSGRAMAPAVSPRLLTAKFQVLDLCWAQGQVSLPVLRFSPVCTVPPVLHTHLHLHAGLTRRTNQRSLGTFHKATLFQKSSSAGEPSTFI